MRNDRRKQIMTICIMIVAVLAISVGFAAFSSILEIESGATYTVDSDVFKIKFSKSSTSILDGSSNPVSPVSGNGGSAIITNEGTPTITNLHANFTSPGQSVVYEFYTVNQTPYDAYLTLINYLNISGKSLTKECVAKDGATESLVARACEGINVKVEVGTTLATSTTQVENHKLGKGTSEKIRVIIEYTGQIIDGSMDITFGDISLIYSTADEQVEELPETDPSLYTGAIYTNSGDTLYIGDNTPISYARTPLTINESYYLKHDIVNNVITASYACITYEENGIRKDVCVRGGDSSYYESNQEILRSIESYFNTLSLSNGSPAKCIFSESSSTCLSASLTLHAHSSGHVYSDNGRLRCRVMDDGDSFCNVVVK